LAPFFPLANLSDDALAEIPAEMTNGIYFGYAWVLGLSGNDTEISAADGKVHPMVMSLGWNPFYKNEKLTAACTLTQVVIVNSQVLIGNSPSSQIRERFLWLFHESNRPWLHSSGA
jgi:hypothetical protein